MSFLTCPQCSGRSLFVRRSPCSQCGSEVAAAATNIMEDKWLSNQNLSQQQTCFKTSRDSDVDCRSGNHLIAGDAITRSETLMKINKKINPNDLKQTAGSEFQTRLQQEKCNESSETLSSSNQKGNGNRDFVPETSKTEVHSSFEDNKVKENWTINKNITSNISITQSFLNDNRPFRDQKAEASNKKSNLPPENIDVFPSPSGIQKKIKISEISDENLQLKKCSETQSSESGVEKTYICKFCDMDVSNHAEEREHEQKFYKCCCCCYTTSEQGSLQMHSYSHQPKNICNICEKIYIGNSHNDVRTCMVCMSTNVLRRFKCRTELNEHYLDHQKKFEPYCWVCYGLIKKHSTKCDGKLLYTCCACSYKSYDKPRFKNHNNNHHRPLRFCRICKEEYDPEEKTLHASLNKCFGCGEKFHCKTQLEDHLVGHENVCSTHCFLCGRKINEHIPKLKVEAGYECCECRELVRKTNLKPHLTTHSKLRLFKCDFCGKRLFHKGTHSENCSKLSFKCEICGVPFLIIDSLDKHRLEKHC